ncbi:YbjN domain-containing protein [Rubritalea marina]|uniref:YbjN domain-containing protein n=1 Tax=Rubritalea marina TaxID=361055 RepID=UPI00035EB4DF|nr:YbjN domain-containing protein [Rubritalea marina]
MRPPSIQLNSVVTAFNEQGWAHEIIEGQEVLSTAFEAHHTRVQLFAQVFNQLNSLTIVGETAMPIDELRQPLLLELLHRANKQMNLGGLEYDLDRQRLVFRITNIFEREKFDKDIVSTMVHCTIAEVDRITPFCTIVQQTAEDLLDDLSIERLLMRQDLLPPVPGDEEMDI